MFGDNGAGRRLPRRSKIATAILAGVLLGFIFAISYLYGFLHLWLSSDHFVSDKSEVITTSCKSSMSLESLKSQIAKTSKTNQQLKETIKNLKRKLRVAKEHRNNPGIYPKAGPFGTVKASRTNPTITPDQSVNPKLAKILEKVASNNELIVVLANSNYYVKNALMIWLNNIKRIGVGNYLVYALDNDTSHFCLDGNIPTYKRDDGDEIGDESFETIAKTGNSHDVSGLKFRILREFLQLGYSVLMSDVDAVYLQNPFRYLYRDSDIESMTDGHNNRTAYGYDDIFDDPKMGWSRAAHTMRIWVYNSGFFYIRPTAPAIELVDRVVTRLAKEKGWDQTVFNEELFYPSSPGYEGLHISKRTMDYYLFMNSKFLFTTVRKDPELQKIISPVIVHINYHPDKCERMKAVVDYYAYGKKGALDSFPDAVMMEE